MKILRRFFGIFRDSPTFGQDRANLISGYTVGTAALLLNAAVLFLVLPLMLDPDDYSFRMITENVEFGQLLALSLLGGATVFATLLIPLRLISVFWGPRIGRYFDQIVLSGISPLRFIIGKATSQNMFLGLILFLLLPYLILSLALGGVDPVVFVRGLFLVWLYCMALSLVTLWVSLYLNELLSAIAVISGAMFFGALGCIPIPSFQPFVMTPMPVLLHPIYSVIPMGIQYPSDVQPMFIGSVCVMVLVIAVALVGLYLGPLFGIIRENSTFGEVVRAGDTKKKRWFRLRHHIQRPSEIAFFYENRGDSMRRHEGFIRWSAGLFALIAIAISVYAFFGVISQVAPGFWSGVYEIHSVYLTVHAVGLLLAVALFTHAKNTTFVRIPFWFGRKCTVGTLDTCYFLLFVLVSTAMAIAVPFLAEKYLAAPAQQTIFPPSEKWREPDFERIAIFANLLFSCCALVIYVYTRILCQRVWIKLIGVAVAVPIFFLFVCLIPAAAGAIIYDVPEFRQIEWLSDWSPTLMTISPIGVLLILYEGMSPTYPQNLSIVPVFIVLAVLLFLGMIILRWSSKRLRREYLMPHLSSAAETRDLTQLAVEPAV